MYFFHLFRIKKREENTSNELNSLKSKHLLATISSPMKATKAVARENQSSPVVNISTTSNNTSNTSTEKIIGTTNIDPPISTEKSGQTSENTSKEIILDETSRNTSDNVISDDTNIDDIPLDHSMIDVHDLQNISNVSNANISNANISNVSNVPTKDINDLHGVQTTSNSKNLEKIAQNFTPSHLISSNHDELQWNHRILLDQYQKLAELHTDLDLQMKREATGKQTFEEENRHLRKVVSNLEQKQWSLMESQRKAWAYWTKKYNIQLQRTISSFSLLQSDPSEANLHSIEHVLKEIQKQREENRQIVLPQLPLQSTESEFQTNTLSSNATDKR